MLASQRTYVGRARVRGASWDDPALRLLVARQVGSAELRPPGMGPAEILVLRGLSTPALRLSPGGGLAGGGAGVEWAAALKRHLAELYGKAARGDARDPSAWAVVFRDGAELVAAYLLDLVRGRVDAHWWWAELARFADLPRLEGKRVPTILREFARETPQVLHELHQGGGAIELLAGLAAHETRDVLAAVLSEHGVGHSGTAALERMTVPEVAAPEPRRDDFGPAQVPDQRTRQGARALRAMSAPWRNSLPASETAVLGRGAECLLGWCLALVQHRGAARSISFAARAVDWLEFGARGAALDREEAREPLGTAAERDPTPASEGGESRRGHGARAPASTELRASEVLSNGRGQPGAHAAPEAFMARGIAASGSHGREPTPMRNAELPVAAGASGVATDLAGVFYLVGLMRALDLPDCFEANWSLASRVGAWQTLEGLARGLLGPRLGEYAGDSVFALLAELDGRTPDVPLGEGLIGHERFELPRRWIEFIRAEHDEPVAVPRVRTSRGTVRVELAGLLLAEWRQTEADPVAEARRWLIRGGADPACVVASDGASPTQEEPAPAELSALPESPVWTGFVQRLLPFVRHRLGRALGGDGAGGEWVDALATPGRVYATATHVDVAIPLERISLAVRRAGLDCDPGWVPELGRIVQFHFESEGGA